MRITTFTGEPTMNIKRLCLVAGLLSLPVTYASAAEEITINVRVEVTNLPAASRQVVGFGGADWLM